MLKRFCLINLVFSVLWSGLPLVAQTNRQLEKQTINVTQTEKRTALIIGNGHYQNVSVLDNPVNDANDMAVTLQSLGFEVIKGTDTSLVQMRRLIREFGEKLERQKGIGLFYYAGHGVEMNGKNFLIPVDADITREVETEDYALDVNSILRQMDEAKNGFNIVILDACRNNPFSRGWSRSGDTGGLANINAPTGTYIAYAAAPGSVASDGRGTRNGLFTGVLIKQLKRPGLKLEEVFKGVREEVMRITGDKQVPWDSSSIKGDFYFNLTTVKSQPTTKTEGKTGIEPTNVAKDKVTQEREAWDLVKNSDDMEDFRFFLKEFPSGANAGRAKILLEELVWISVKTSNNKEKVQAYLNEFPNGANVSAARIKLRQLGDITNTAEKRPNITTKNSGSFTAGTVKKNSIGIELVYIPPGEFLMGSDNGGPDENPVHKVTFEEGFWIGKYEVTQAQYKSVMGTNPSNFKKNCSQCPVEQVSWNDAKVFVAKLNAQNDGFIYSLPSEAQWEYAARAGTTNDYYGDLNSIGWYLSNSNKSIHPVGQKQANAFGLYDMSGNVWEWCEDIYNSSYNNLPTDGSSNTSIGDSGLRLLRGGSWDYAASHLRSANRFWDKPGVQYYTIGFRVAAQSR